MFTRMTKSFNQLSSTLRSGYNNASFEAEVQATIAAPQAFEVIAVMGPTGCGKSTFINTLCPGQVKVGHDLSSCTEEIVEAKCEIDGKPVVLVDTPGFNDTNQRNRSDTVILEKLMDFMRESWEEKMLLSGVIYLHDLTEARMTGSNVTNLRMFRSLCGGDGLRNVFLTLTKWNETPLEDAERRQRELESPGGFWGPYLAGGSKICRFMNTKESAEDLVREILRGRRFIPQIQEETMKGKSVKQTEAGSLLNKALDELREAHAKETEALKAELARSASQNDEKMRLALVEHKKSLDAKVADIVREQRMLNESKVEQLERRVQELQKLNPNGLPEHKLRLWRRRFRCMACKETKTHFEGVWECPGCHQKQYNIPDGKKVTEIE